MNDGIPARLTETLPAVTRRGGGLALVLGAGATRGFAHVGILKVLEGAGIPVGMVVGTSVGSFVGAMFAYGHTAFDIQEMAMTLDRSDVLDIMVPRNGFVRGGKLEAYVNRQVRNAPLEEFRVPFHAVATDIRTGKERIISTGDAGMAVRASCAIPGIFQPVRVGEETCVDGCLVSPVAVDAAREMGADAVVAVDICAGLDNSLPAGLFDTMIQSYVIMCAKIAQEQDARADVVIRPQVGRIFAGDFTKRHDAILEGEKAARQALPEILEILERLGE